MDIYHEKFLKIIFYSQGQGPLTDRIDEIGNDEGEGEAGINH